MKRHLHRLEDLVLILLVVCLLVLTCGQILLRNFFSLTFLGSENLVRHLVLWIAMSGALLATRLDKHIRIDAVLRLVPDRIRTISLSCADAFAAAICALLTSISWRFVLDEQEFGGLAFFDVPAWIAQLCFPLAFGLMSIRFLSHAWHRLRDPIAKDLP